MTVSSDQSSIARTYYEAMRGSFASYNLDEDTGDPALNLLHQKRAEKIEAVTQTFEELDPLNGAKPSLGQLFKIEIDLLSLIPETALRARYWTIENRFTRVVPKGVAQDFIASRLSGPVHTAAQEEVRQVARNLLGVIHSNYETNFKREILIRRLMTVLAAASAILILITGTTANAVLPVGAQQGLLLITMVGMAGAIISTIQRLQKATSRDAMVDDGIFELISLRVGWLSILMSVGVGGVSALFIYALVSAGLIDSALPQIAANPASLPRSDGADAGLVADLATRACRPGQTCAHWADAIYRALGLESRGDMFKLTVYSFVAGFAERFVPDTINRLAKEAIPPDPLPEIPSRL